MLTMGSRSSDAFRSSHLSAPCPRRSVFLPVLFFLVALVSVWSQSTPAVAQEPVGRLGAEAHFRDSIDRLPTDETKNLALRMAQAVDRCDVDTFRRAYEEGSQLSMKDTGLKWPDFESLYESDKTLPPLAEQAPGLLGMSPRDPKPSQELYFDFAGEMILWLAYGRFLKVDKYIFSLIVAADREPGTPVSKDALRPAELAALALTEAAEATTSGDDATYQAIIDRARELSAEATAKSEEVREDSELLSDEHKNNALVWKTLAEDLENSRKEAKSKGSWGKTSSPSGERQGGFLLERGLKPGEEYASAQGASPSTPFTGFEIAFTPGASFGSIRTRQATFPFPSKTKGKDIHYDAVNLHGDFRYYAGDFMGFGDFHPRLLVGLKGAGTLGGAEKGLRADDHPPGGAIDSFVKYEIGGTITPYAGLVLADFDCSRVNLLVGPRITFAEITGITDESGGGGVLEKFSRNVVQVGPAVGVELDFPIPFTRHDNFEAGVRVAGWGEYLPGVDVSGNSSTFPFDYRFETKGAFLGTVRAGFFARFNGF